MRRSPTRFRAETACATCASVRIGRFEALGLPHRRIEAWKYTDLRNAMKVALPPAVGDDTEVTEADVAAALGPLADIAADRAVFVNGAYRPDLSQLASLKDILGSPLERRAQRQERQGCRRPAAPQ